MSRLRYTVEPGRTICRDGKPIISIHRELDARGNGELTPAETDELTRIIARYLNERDSNVL